MPLVAPAGTVTLPGTEATDELLLVSVTTAPPAGAEPDSVTVPVEGFPPTTLDGFTDTVLNVTTGAAVTVSEAVLVIPPYTAESVTAVEPDTALVVTANVPLLAPPDTVTLDGTVAADGVSLLSGTTAPPAGAGPLSVTVPVEGFPPTTLDGFTDTVLNVTTGAAVTVSEAVLVIPPYTAESVTAVEPDTALVVTANVPLLAPPDTVTLDGTVAADGVSLLSGTTAPPAGAGPLSVTVPVEGFPPTTLDGFTDTVLNVTTGAAVTVSEAVLVIPPYTAESVTAVEPDTALVVTANVPLLAPPDTVMLDGTVAADGVSLLSGTTAPPAGAGPLSVTVPVEGFPPTTLDGFTDTVLNVTTGAAVTVSEAVLVIPPYTAESVTAVEPDTALVVTANVPLLAPPDTVTLDGTVAADGVSLLSGTTAPPAGAGPLSVTVPVEGFPPTTLDGFTDREDSAGYISKPIPFDVPPPGGAV